MELDLLNANNVRLGDDATYIKLDRKLIVKAEYLPTYEELFEEREENNIRDFAITCNDVNYKSGLSLSGRRLLNAGILTAAFLVFLLAILLNAGGKIL